MTILFGWNSFALKKFTPQELGAAYDPASTLKIEYRQKFAHVFFIPIFPIGTFWAIRKDGKLYEPSAEMLQALQGIRVGGKKWLWSFTGPIAAVVIFFFASITERVQQRGYEQFAKAQTALLDDFFKDSTKTMPLADKIGDMRALADSALEKDEYKHTITDTSTASLLTLYFAASATQSDSMKGYTPDNTLTLSKFHFTPPSTKEIIDNKYEESLWKGKWTGYSTDTSSVFKEYRKIQQYKYLLIVKEYDRILPEVMEKGYNSGYSFVNAVLIQIDSKKIIKKFKVMAENSGKISEFSYGKSSVSKTDWMSRLHNDLTRNATRAAENYVFGKKPAIGL